MYRFHFMKQVKGINFHDVFNRKMKQVNKCRAALILFDIVMVLLILFVYGQTAGNVRAVGAENSVRREVKMNGDAGIDGEEMINGDAGIDNESTVSGAAGTNSEAITNGEVKKIAITFDDGPHYAYTKVLLDGLKERGVVATFFVTGEHAVLHPDLIKRMHDEGHLVGNHTYSHMQLRAGNHEEYKEELVLTSELLEEIIGEEITFVRPPYGSWDKSFEEELNLIPVLWTVDPLDWCSSSVECIVQNTVCDVEENDIILMHDYYETSVTAALQIVDMLLEDGFTFVTVEEILFE